MRSRGGGRRGALRAPRARLAGVGRRGEMARVTTREQAAALDAADPLARFRERFVFTQPASPASTGEGDERVLYLDGNSLGRLPLATRDRLQALVAEWGERLVAGWHEWIDAPGRVGDLLAEGVLGAEPGEVIVSDSTTVNLYKLVSAALGDGGLVT